MKFYDWLQGPSVPDYKDHLYQQWKENEEWEVKARDGQMRKNSSSFEISTMENRFKKMKKKKQ